MNIKNRRLHLVFHTNPLKCQINRCLCLTCNDRNSISDKTDMTVKNQSVIRAHLRGSLSCKRKTLLRNVLIGKNTDNSRNLHCILCLNGVHPRICMRTSQYLDDQRILRCQIICIHRFSCYQCHRICFLYRLIYIFHFMIPPVFFYSSDISECLLSERQNRSICTDFLPDIP